MYLIQMTPAITATVLAALATKNYLWVSGNDAEDYPSDLKNTSFNLLIDSEEGKLYFGEVGDLEDMLEVSGAEIVTVEGVPKFEGDHDSYDFMAELAKLLDNSSRVDIEGGVGYRVVIEDDFSVLL